MLTTLNTKVIIAFPEGSHHQFRLFRSVLAVYLFWHLHYTKGIKIMTLKILSKYLDVASRLVVKVKKKKLTESISVNCLNLLIQLRIKTIITKTQKKSFTCTRF